MSTPSSRDRMVQSASQMLAQQGYEATSFRGVIEASHAPRGSIYHHFPGGKDQLVIEALQMQRERALRLISQPAETAEEYIDRFVNLWSDLLSATDYCVGCSLVGATTGGAPASIQESAGEAFTEWSDTLAEGLAAADPTISEPGSLAVMMLAACEGAVVIARATRSLAPIEVVRTELHALRSLRSRRS